MTTGSMVTGQTPAVLSVPVIAGNQSIKDTALALAAAGFAVFPVDYPGLPRCAGVGQDHDPGRCGQRGKHPAVNFTTAATSSPKMIAMWFDQQRNIGAMCGDKLVVIDEDSPREFQRYASEHGVAIPTTMIVSTAKGQHYYFEARAGHQLGNHEGGFGPYDINVRAGNAYVVAPGSLHATGVTYTMVTTVAPAPIPNWVIDAVEQGARSAAIQPEPWVLSAASFGVLEPVNVFGDAPRGLAAVPTVIRGPRADSGGQRHQELVAYASSMRGRGLPYEEAETLYRAVWGRCEQPPVASSPLPWDDARSKLVDVYNRYPGGLSADYATTDDNVDPAATHARAVDLEATKIRVREAARALVDAETRPGESTDPATLAAEYLTVTQLAGLPKLLPLVEGALSRDWALCLAMGKPWQGRAVNRVKVLYVAGGGVYGVAERIRAWEYGWGIKVDPEWFTVRKSAVNMFRPGPAFDDLLQRVGSYGFVVLDTLRRHSGGADGNSTDMGVVVDNVDRAKRATDNGTVLILAHTDKGDNDSRGFSGIEDDADTVWHARRDGLRVELECTKQKDGPDQFKVQLEMHPVGDSLIVSAGTSATTDEDGTAEQIVMQAMSGMFSQTGATATEVIEATGLAKTSFYWARGKLLKSGRLVSVGTTSRRRLEMP